LFSLGLFFSRGKVKGGILTFITFFPLALFSYFINPDWAFMYFVKHSDLPRYIPYLVFATYPLIFFVSLFLGRKMNEKNLKILLVFSLFAFLILFFATADRVFFYGTSDNFKSVNLFPPSTENFSEFLKLVREFFTSYLGLFILSGGAVFSLVFIINVLRDEKLKDFWFRKIY